MQQVAVLFYFTAVGVRSLILISNEDFCKLLQKYSF